MVFTRDTRKPTNPVKVIRQFCTECMCGVMTEVAKCTAPKCPLYDWRMGKNPYRTKREYTVAERAVMAERLKDNIAASEGA